MNAHASLGLLPAAEDLRLAMLGTYHKVPDDPRVQRLAEATRQLYELGPEQTAVELMAQIDDILPEIPGLGAAVARCVNAWHAFNWTDDISTRRLRAAGEAYEALVISRGFQIPRRNRRDLEAPSFAAKH